MRNLVATAIIAGFSITSAPIAFAQEATPNADTVLAVVNGTEITLGHVILLRTQLPQQYLAAPDDILFQGILDQLIDQTLLGEAVTEESREMRMTLENEARALRAAIIIDGIVNAEITDEQYQAAYDEAFADFEPEEEFNASHILVETEEEANAIMAELEAGADFAEMAIEKSTGPSGPDGGALGWFGLGMMVQPFEEAVVGLETGALGGPVQTQFGWHVVKLNEKREQPIPTLDDVKDELTQQIQQSALEGQINSLREGAEIAVTVEGIDPALIKNLELLQE